ncbi:MAG: hypothetical protein U1F58_06665 [Burkholderiales bacterium]
MKTYGAAGWKHRVVFLAATIALAVGGLEMVARGMMHPDPETVAARRQFIAAEAERAGQIRDLEKGEIRFATVAAPGEP